MPSAKRAATTRDASGITTKRVRSEKKTNSAKGAPKKVRYNGNKMMVENGLKKEEKIA